MATSPALLKGFQVLRVGERKQPDREFASDEYLLAAPGSVVAKRRHGEKPNMANAVKALARTAVDAAGSSTRELTEKRVAASIKRLTGAQAGALATQSSIGDVFAGSSILQGLLQLLGGDEVGRLGIPQMNLALQESLGYIYPDLLGITDPQEFRIRMALHQLDPTQQQGLRAALYAVAPSSTTRTAPLAQAIFSPAGTAATKTSSGGVRAAVENYLSGLNLQIPTMASKQAFGRGILQDLGGPFPALARRSQAGVVEPFF